MHGNVHKHSLFALKLFGDFPRRLKPCFVVYLICSGRDICTAISNMAKPFKAASLQSFKCLRLVSNAYKLSGITYCIVPFTVCFILTRKSITN